MTTVIDAVTDRAQWIERWQACGREPFAHPSFSQLFAGKENRAVALVVEHEDGFALLPLLIRPIPGSHRDLYDAISPYGYGGPFFSGTPAPKLVMTELQAWVRRTGLCSTFLRLSLGVDLLPGRRTPTTEVVDTSVNVVVDLQRTPDELWAQYEHKVRKNVKKALRAGCTVRRDDELEDMQSFLDVYRSTMIRRGAAARYHFDRAFFGKLSRELAGNYSVFSVLDNEGQVVSVEFVLESDHFLYSFLGGTRAEAFSISPNDLLKHEVVLHGQRTGRRGFVLGGGYEPGDGIFRYKRSFDPSGVQPYRTVRLIGDQARYAELVDESALGDPRASSVSDYFPAYRAPVSE
ncbi:MAG TPA: GNAT family N-acetyltransferase [Kribbella sp.]